MPKPALKSEDQARADAMKWLHKPEHTHPNPGDEEKTRSDDVDDPKHNADHPVHPTDSDDPV